MEKCGQCKHWRYDKGEWGNCKMQASKVDVHINSMGYAVPLINFIFTKNEFSCASFTPFEKHNG